MIWFGVYRRKPAAFVDEKNADGETRYNVFVKKGRNWQYNRCVKALPEVGQRTFGERIADTELANQIAIAPSPSMHRRLRLTTDYANISRGIQEIYRALRKEHESPYSSDRTEVVYIMRTMRSSETAQKLAGVRVR